MAVAFDILKLARKLEAAGFAQKQAADTSEALAEALTTAELVTKEYLDFRLRETELRLRETEQRLEAKTRETELRLETKLGEVKIDILKWVGGLLLAQAAVIAALVKLL